MDKEYVERTFLSRWEALQEDLGASYGNRNRTAYEREYGPFLSEEDYIKSVSEIIDSPIY